MNYSTQQDEQGDPWPPPLALAAYVKNYGGSPVSIWEGELVCVGPYLKTVGYFECYTTSAKAGERLFCLPEELTPINDATAYFIDQLMRADVEIYADEVYELRDDLDKLGIAVRAESIAEWTAQQRAKVREYVNAVQDGMGEGLALPKELR
jgi:hypothetical protein